MTSVSTGLQLGVTSGVPTLNLQATATSKTGQTGLQIGGLGQQQKAAPSLTLTSQPQKTTGVSLTGGISLGTSATGIGTTGLATLGKPPPAYTAPSSTVATTVIPATSVASSAPTGGKKYTYKQLEKMINEVCPFNEIIIIDVHIMLHVFGCRHVYAHMCVNIMICCC